MSFSISRRATLRAALVAGLGAAALSSGIAPAAAQGVTLRLSSPSSATDQRALALLEVFGPAIKDIATFQPHWNATLFKQGTELEAIARGNLEMSITSAQELAALIPAWSIFTAGYLLRDADHQKKVFASDVMDGLKKTTEDRLGVKLLSVMYLGRRQLNLRTEKEIKTPADLAGLKLRMPNSKRGCSSARRSAPIRCRWPSPKSTPRCSPARSMARTTRCRQCATPSSSRSPSRSC
jgi:TRAP-type transport system periplasmic protein